MQTDEAKLRKTFDKISGGRETIRDSSLFHKYLADNIDGYTLKGFAEDVENGYPIMRGVYRRVKRDNRISQDEVIRGEGESGLRLQRFLTTQLNQIDEVVTAIYMNVFGVMDKPLTFEDFKKIDEYTKKPAL